MINFSQQYTAKQAFLLYKQFGRQVFEQSASIAKKLKGLEVVHINSTAAGGGVVELLKNQVPLEKNLGLNSRWLVLNEPKPFFVITKKIHNLLQGKKGLLSEPEKAYYIERLKKPGQELEEFLSKTSKPLVVILHDAQVLPLINYLPSNTRAVIRMHIDLSTANNSALTFLKPYMEKADKVVVSHELYKPGWLNKQKTAVSFPSINPFAKKNRTVNHAQAAKLFKHFGISMSRPLITQVSRFDPWKDPQGVIDAYYLAKKQIPNLQLVLEGAMEAKDDPEAKGIYNLLKMEYKNDPDIFFHGEKTLKDPLYQVWINALQTYSHVVIQKSLREGFGLTVTEAMWKGKAVIGGNAAGIKVQIQNGKNGFIVKSPAECAKRAVELIKNPRLASALGKKGHETVRKNFLFNRLVLDFLKIYKELS